MIESIQCIQCIPAVIQDANTLSMLITDTNTLKDIVVVVISSMIGGAAKTSNVLRRFKLVPFKTSMRQFIEDAIGAIVAGLIVYLMAESAELKIHYEALLIIVAGYLGSTLTEAAGNKLIKQVNNE